MITILSGFCLLYNAHLIFQWDYKLIIIYCCVSSFTIMVHRLLKSRNLSQYCCFNIFESLVLISYLLSIVYYLEVEKVNINFISYAQLVLQFLILSVTVLVNRNTSDNDALDQSFQIQEILIAAFKSISALQLVFVSLRITGQITWGWIQTLIIIWFLLGLSFVIAIQMQKQVRRDRRRQKINHQLKQFIYLSQRRDLYKFDCIWNHYITICNSIRMCFETRLSCCLTKSVCLWINNPVLPTLISVFLQVQIKTNVRNEQYQSDYFLYYDMAQSNLYVEQQIQQINQNQQQIENRIQLKMKRMHKVSISKVPQFMVRLSQTYYRCAQNPDKQHKPSTVQKNKQNQMDNQYQMNDNEQSKRFDLLLSSPRQRLEISSSLGQDLTSRNSDKKQFEDQSSLKQEQQNQNSQKLCLVCYEKENNMINMPCGHGGFCKECCEQLLSKSELCYLCRKPVTHSLQIQEVQNRESLVEVIEVLEQQNY
ncbi:unnamed protein product [Paramecium octaurelia]|uniref:RING-type domain-containing protein n=1 Tax=Paramecium octaurelia TaxID=43137 RepID=A0A8S1TXS4_PAROT|nr:unnamed protein product [Paramecium octaurelia]